LRSQEYQLLDRYTFHCEDRGVTSTQARLRHGDTAAHYWSDTGHSGYNANAPLTSFLPPIVGSAEQSGNPLHHLRVFAPTHDAKRFPWNVSRRKKGLSIDCGQIIFNVSISSGSRDTLYLQWTPFHGRIFLRKIVQSITQCLDLDQNLRDHLTAQAQATV
jgi:hypothetical protein